MVKKKNSPLELRIEGMSCQSCEVLLERTLKKVKGVSKVEVNYKTGVANIWFSKTKPSLSQLKAIVEKEGYAFANNKKQQSELVSRKKHFLELGGILVILLGFFLLFGNSEIFNNFELTGNMSFGVIFLIGVTAAFSSCLAVTGGLLVSVTANYVQTHPHLSSLQKFKPHLYFNSGRIIGYTLFGAIIGFFGSMLSISPKITGIITIFASIIMILLGFQLLGLSPKLSGLLTFRFPKFLSHSIMQSSETPRKSTPFLLGCASFFLPCGFTYALELYVLSKGDPVLGAVTMFAFSLGTLPGLLSLGVLSSFLKGTSKRIFFKTAGAIVIFLGILTLPNGLALTGIHVGNSPSENVISEDASQQPLTAADQNVRIENGVQIVEMQVKGFDYYPHQFTIYKDMPVEWHIDASKASGCAKIITVPKLGITKFLASDKITVITFTPDNLGTLEFMCTMAMTTKGAMFKVVENNISK